MENWGLITYLMRSLLYNPRESSVSDKQWVALVVSHELAHQVTMHFVAFRFCVNQNSVVISSCCFICDLFPFLLLNLIVMLRLSNRRSKSNLFLKIELKWNQFFGWNLFDFDSRLYWQRQGTAASSKHDSWAVVCWICRLNYTNRIPQRPWRPQRQRPRGAAAWCGRVVRSPRPLQGVV